MSHMHDLQFTDAVNSHSRKLWFAAKRNFYYRDDPARAAALCKQIIAQAAFTEEADEAKLLLHDIRLDIRRLVGGTGKRTVRTNEIGPRVVPERRAGSRRGMKFIIATAVVILPILGIARDGIIGIVLPQAAAAALLGSFFWLFSRIRKIWNAVVRDFMR